MRFFALVVVCALPVGAASIETSVDLQASLYNSGLFASCSKAGGTSASCSLSYNSNDPAHSFGAYGTGSVSASESAVTITGILIPTSAIPGTPASIEGDYRAVITQLFTLSGEVADPYAFVNINGTWNPYRSAYQLSASGATNIVDRAIGGTGIDRGYAVPLNPWGTTLISVEVYLTANEYDMADGSVAGFGPRLSVQLAPIEIYSGDPLGGGQALSAVTLADVPEPRTTGLLAAIAVLCLGSVGWRGWGRRRR